MDYEKEYKKLIARIKDAYHDESLNDERFCCVVNKICPEIIETEDEKIKKDVIHHIEFGMEKSIIPKARAELWIAWLESLPQKLSNLERTGKNWKPTEEQIAWVNIAKDIVGDTGREYLQSLYKQLKAL